MELSALVKALPSDKDEIIALVHGVVKNLNQNGIPQWDDVYPSASDVEEDLKNGQLYALRASGKIIGIITLNRESEPDYQYAKWQYRGSDYAVVHRLCVSSAAQGQGIGTKLMLMAEAMLKQRGIKSVRLDAFSKNPQSLRLYEKLGYRIVGEANWRKGRFYLLEKDITASSENGAPHEGRSDKR